MARKITCAGCSTTYTLADTFQSKSVACKRCGARIDVDAAAPPPPDPPVAARPLQASHAEARGKGSPAPPANVRSRRERAMQKDKPFYTSPIFYVSAVAVLVCGYFAAKFH